MSGAGDLNEQMRRDRIEIDRLKAETKTIRDETRFACWHGSETIAAWSEKIAMKLRPNLAFWLAFLGITLCVTILPVDTHPTANRPLFVWPEPPILSLFLVGIGILALLLYLSPYVTSPSKDDQV